MEFGIDDKVSIKDNARRVLDNSKISTKLKSKIWYIKSINNDIVTLTTKDKKDEELELNISDIDNSSNQSNNINNKSETSKFKLNDKVLIKKDADWADGSKIPAYYYAATFYVLYSEDLVTAISNKRNGNKIGVLYTKDLKFKK